jgi:hypothetical protein
MSFMPQILKNFLNSEKAIASAIPLIIATVFVFTGKITEQEWMNFAMAITGIYVGGKAIHGAAAAGSKHKADAEAAKNELADLREALATNDDDTDDALEDKFDEDGAD